MKNYYYGLLLFTLLFSCNDIKRENTKSEIGINKSESFEEFFKKFSSDSFFRNSRINFPLKGFNSDDSNTNGKDEVYLWSKEDWSFYSEEDFSNKKDKDEKKTETIKKNKSLITYRIYKENSGYDIQYEFKKENDKWFLIYYSYKKF